MSREREAFGDRETNFDPLEFRALKVRQLEDDSWREKYEFWFSSLHKFLTTEEFGRDRLLELANGPTVYNVALPASYFSTIVLSDKVERNIDELWKWMRRDPDYLDWTQFFKKAAIAAQRENVEEACKEMEENIRNNVKDIVFCDVKNANIIPRSVCQEPFDVIITSLALENSVASQIRFIETLRNMSSLLKEGGKLVMMSLLKNTGYIMGSYRSPAVSLSEDEVELALSFSEYIDIQMEVKEQSEDENIAYFVSATKR